MSKVAFPRTLRTAAALIAALACTAPALAAARRQATTASLSTAVAQPATVPSSSLFHLTEARPAAVRDGLAKTMMLRCTRSGARMVC